MIKSEKIEALAAALLTVQAEIKPAVKDATNPFIKNRYSSIDAVWDAARPALQSAGIAVVQVPEDSDGSTVKLTTLLIHTSGQYIGGTLSVPVTVEKGKSPAQVVGSGISYARRYGLASMLGITHEDDDGCAAGGQSKPQYQQRPVQAAITPDAAFDAMNVPLEARATLYDAAMESAHGDKQLAAQSIARWSSDGYLWDAVKGALTPKK